jgi:hypothetical protein
VNDAGIVTVCNLKYRNCLFLELFYLKFLDRGGPQVTETAGSENAVGGGGTTVSE